MTDEHPTREKWLHAYDNMMARVKTAFEEAEESTLPALRKFIQKARDTTVELEELTKDEAEKVSMYLQRDIEDAGKHLAETGHELGDWLRFDIDRVEDRLLEIFSRVADQTRIEWIELQQELRKDPPFHSGEVTGPGTLYCASCNEALHFHHTARIPPCPTCRNGTFLRWPLEQD